MDRENSNPFTGGFPMSNPSPAPPPPENDSEEDQFLAYVDNIPRYSGAEDYHTPARYDDYNAPRYGGADGGYNAPPLAYEHPLASQLARLTLDQAAPRAAPVDILQQLRIQSAARGTPPPQSYQSYSYRRGLLINNATLYNSLPMNGAAATAAAVSYNQSPGLNGNALNFYDSRRDSFGYERHRLLLNGNNNAPRFQYENEIQTNNFNRSIAVRPNSAPLTRPRQQQQQQRPNLVPLHEMRGKIVTVAKDQFGCRFLQNKFAEGNPDEIQMIFVEIKDHIYELIVHQFGNYLISKLVEVCNQDQMNQLLMVVINDDRKFAEICADMYGTRVVQKLLEHLTTQEQRCRVISVLRRITVSLTKTMNGHHVLQYCLKFFSIDDNKHILNVVADNCLDIATDKSGCCVLQQCLEHALGEPRQRLIAKLTSNALQLSHHPFGNYVVQYILGLNIGYATTDILRQLSGNFVFLCMDKYGSNVVEKCLKEAEDNQKIPVIEEIIYSPNFLEVLQDPYGNYVAQRALNTCKGALLHALIEMINRNSPNLHSHPHGKRVLEKTTKNYKQTFG